MAQREKTDPKLGKQIHEYLTSLGVETPFLTNGGKDAARLEELATHFTGVMNVLGLDLTDDSLQDTPKRVAKMYLHETFYGLDLNNFPKITVVENKFNYDEMLVEKNIGVMSCCEHHFQNIVGHATVAYIPNGKVVGLSKLNRVVDYFSRRPQVQERLTAQIFHALRYVLHTDDVAVVIEADHFCVKARGIQDMHSSTVTSKLGGAFRDDASTRNEFMALCRKMG